MTQEEKTNAYDMVEPKFNPGDFVVDNCGYVWKIEGILNQFYILEGVEGGESHPTIEWVNKTFHLWTIQDAKDGDILTSEDGYPFVYAGNHIYTKYLKAYCGIANNGKFEISDKTELWTNDNVEPSTKEEHDLLFSKMKEAGYEWDAEKKELKEIKQEDEEYNGEDYGIDSLYHAQRILEKTLGKVEGYQSDDGILSHKCAITAVKKLYKKKPTGWSEEDERFLEDCIDVLYSSEEYGIPLKEKIENWLESLKERVQPQNQWKPSDEQMEALANTLSLAKNCGEESAFDLRTLYEQLKKL